jgi:hypothetical protein
MSPSFDPLLQVFMTSLTPPRLLSGFSRLSEEELRLWVESIDDSPYGLEDWARALIRFARWEEAHRELTLEQKRTYLLCCIEGAGASAHLLPLETILENYLETHGVRD